ncbi:MAG: Rpn family recombination-promoting nuclease/putative transposase [Verrucomicrobiales bacterium]
MEEGAPPERNEVDDDAEFLRELVRQPHDAFFKRTFSSLPIAREFFQRFLPAAIAARLDWAGLSQVHASFVAADLGQSHADLMFRAPLLGGGEIRLYLLLEHQSEVQAHMPLRLLGYMVRFWEAHLREEGVPLPPVVPLVLHQGPDRWSVSAEFAGLVDLPADLAGDLAPFTPAFRHGLLDLVACDPENAFGGETAAAIRLMKMARARGTKIGSFFDWLVAEWIGLGELGEGLVELMILYALHVEQDLDVRGIAHNLSKANPNLAQAAMTAADKLRAEGRLEGRLEGRQEGRQEGRLEGRQEGRSEGEWIGKLQLLEQLMGERISPSEELTSLTLAELKGMFAALQQRYEARFKAR